MERDYQACLQVHLEGAYRSEHRHDPAGDPIGPSRCPDRRRPISPKTLNSSVTWLGVCCPGPAAGITAIT